MHKSDILLLVSAVAFAGCLYFGYVDDKLLLTIAAVVCGVAFCAAIICVKKRVPSRIAIEAEQERLVASGIPTKAVVVAVELTGYSVADGYIPLVNTTLEVQPEGKAAYQVVVQRFGIPLTIGTSVTAYVDPVDPMKVAMQRFIS